MQRFFVEPHQIDEEAHQIHITGTDVNHIANVLRMKQGEELWISDGGKCEYRCTIEAFEPDEVLLHIIYSQEPDYELPSRIYLFQGLPKADKMELIIQKAVELGAYEVIPVETRRCVVKLDGKKAAKKVDRWQQIAESAAKQSKRMLIPHVHEVITFKEALKYAESMDIRLIPYELARDNGNPCGDRTGTVHRDLHRTGGRFRGKRSRSCDRRRSEADHPRTTDPPHRDSRTCDSVCPHVPA